jgi:hypothetical protein
MYPSVLPAIADVIDARKTAINGLHESHHSRLSSTGVGRSSWMTGRRLGPGAICTFRP